MSTQFNGSLDVNSVYETIPMMVIPYGAKWSGHITQSNPSSEPRSLGVPNEYGFYFKLKKPLTVSAIGMDYRTSDGRTNPTRLRIYNDSDVKTNNIDIMLPRDRIVDDTYYKQMIRPVVLPPGNYYFLVTLMDADNTLKAYQGCTRPLINELDQRIKDCISPIKANAFFNKNDEYTQYARNSIRELPLLHGGAAALCGNIWCDMVKNVATTTCDTFVGHEIRLLRSDMAVKHTSVGGKYYQTIHPKVTHTSDLSIIGSGYGDRSIVDIPEPSDMYKVEIEFIHSLPNIGNATISFDFDSVLCSPSYTSIIGQTGGKYEFDFHPTKIGVFDFQVKLLIGEYIQMTKLVITKVF
jgi:hypothetical protein